MNFTFLLLVLIVFSVALAAAIVVIGVFVGWVLKGLVTALQRRF